MLPFLLDFTAFLVTLLYFYDSFLPSLHLEIVQLTMQLIVIRFLCTTFVAIEEDIYPSTIKISISSRTISSFTGTGNYDLGIAYMV